MDLQTVSQVATCVSATFIAVGSVLTLRHFRLARTGDFIQRFNSPGFQATRVAVDQYMHSLDSQDYETKCATFRTLLTTHTPENIILRDHIWSLCMLFSELGFAKRSLQIHPTAVKSLNRLIPCYWHALAPYVREFNIREDFLKERDKRPIDDPNVKLGAFAGFRYIYLWFKQHGEENMKSNSHPV